jgi:hypothetical protein
MKNKKPFYLLVILAFSFYGFGQDTLSISKKDLFQKVVDKNLQIKIAEKSYESALADYHQSNSLFLPNVSVSYTAIATTNLVPN